MEKLKLEAQIREVGKKGLNRRLRKDGLVPAILYGRGEATRGLSVNAKDFSKRVKEAGLNTLIDLEIVGEKKKAPLVVMLKDFQRDTMTHVITHIDLLKINLQEKVTVKIPVQIAGKAVGLTKGGLVEQTRRELEVKCLPSNIPELIEIDISALDIGDSIHINEVKLPEGVEVPHDVDFTIVSIVAPREEEVAPPPAEAAAALGAEGVPAEGAAPAAGATAATPAETKGEKGEKK